MSRFLGIIAGGALIAAGGFLAFTGVGAAIAPFLIEAGAGTLLGGVGTLLTNRNALSGFASATRNPVQAWGVVYGRCRVGGTMVHCHSWGDSRKMLDMVFVLAAHACEAVEAVYFDQRRLQFDTTRKPSGAHASAGTSFTPVQQSVNIASIKRVKGVVTVALSTNIPLAQEGDDLKIENVSTDATLNGTFPIAQILEQETGNFRFTYLCGGGDVTIGAQGRVRTLWPDFGRKVYFEPLLGDQDLGETFKSMPLGTPYDGDLGNFVAPNNQDGLGGDNTNEPNPWTAYHSCQGKTVVHLRLHYNDEYFKGGLPQISFLVRGKSDIYDPRTDTSGYTTNAALCIADVLAHPEWGFQAEYGTEIPDDYLIAAANLCDEDVPLAITPGPSDITTEKAYTVNGVFDLTLRRGDILQNMLTACGGRLTYAGGQYIIWPAGWSGVSFAIGSDPGGGVIALGEFADLAAGPIRWNPAPPRRDLVNGVRGNYVSQAHKWTGADFPPYAQDELHGYASDALLEADGDERRWADVQLPFTTSPATAQRLAKVDLLRRRGLGSGTLVLNLSAYPIVAPDIIVVTIPFLGWVEKVLEVRATRLALQSAEGGSTGLVYEVDVVETSPDNYEWSTAEELSPQGYVQPRIPGIGELEFYARNRTPGVGVPYPWSPGQVPLLEGDALRPAAATYGLQVSYATTNEGNPTLALEIRGKIPPTRLSTSTAPQITALAGSAGTLVAGTYVIAASAIDTGTPGRNTRISVAAEVTIPIEDDGSGSIDVTLAWPPDASGGGGEVYMAEDDAERGWHLQAEGVGASLTITAFDRDTPGVPDALFHHLAIAWKKVKHSGCFAAQVQAVTATTITLAGPQGAEAPLMTTNQWQGHVLTLLGKLDSTEPLIALNMPVASSTTGAGEFNLFDCVIGPNALGEQLAALDTLLVPGDLLVMRMKPVYTPTSFSDANLANPYSPDGATDEDEPGRLAVVMSGFARGQVATIAAVEEDGGGKKTIFRLADEWRVQPADGDLVIIVEAGFGPETHTQPFETAGEDWVEGLVASPQAPNLAGQTWLVIARSQSRENRNGEDTWAPMREIFAFGSQGTRTIAATQTLLPTDRILNVDASAGPITITLLPMVETPNQTIMFQRVDETENAVVIECAEGDFINGVTSHPLNEVNTWLYIVVKG